MGSIIGSCVGSAICTACCAGCGQCTPEDKFGNASRIPYFFLMVLSGIFAVFMTLYGEKEFDLTFYSGSLCSSSCEGNGSVFRVSFCFFLFEAIHVLFVPFVNDFHWLWFPVKFLVYAGGIIAAFLIDGGNTFFNNYADYFARYASIIYLLIQILILIDWAWSANEWSLRKSGEYVESLELDEEELINNYNCCKNPYDLSRAVISITLYIGSFILIGFFFDWFGGSSCSTHEALIAITIVILVINFVGSGAAGGGTFPVAAIMSTYAMFLLYAALSATESDKCNEFYSDSSTSMWLGIAFVLLALCYSAMKADLLGGAVDMTGISCCGLCPGNTDPDSENAALLGNVNSNDGNYNENAGLGASNYDDAATKSDLKREGKDKAAAASGTDNNDVALNVGEENDKENSDKKKEEDEDDDSPKLTTKQKKQNTIYFHFILMLAGCYMAMLFTDWGDSTGGIHTTGKISQWANMACQWVSMLLFWQSLFIYYKESRTIEE